MDTTVASPEFSRYPSAPPLRGNACECTACHLRFMNVQSFDRHRRGAFAPMQRSCLCAEDLLATGFALTPRDLWRIARTPPLRVEVSRRNDERPLTLASVTARPSDARQ
jgi:hypothetical protein